MSTYFTIWHYLAVLTGILLLGLGIFTATKQQDKKVMFSMIFSTVLVVSVVTVFVVLTLDKYTKKVYLSNLENHRILSIEKIVYTGIVKNTGSYPIGQVTLKIKLVNKGHGSASNVKPGSFFSPSGFKEFFGGGMNVLYKPQTVTKKFVVATDLQPGHARSFRVMFDYPPYFAKVTQFSSVSAH